MKRVFALIIFLGLIYGGWVFYNNYMAQQSTLSFAGISNNPQLVMKESGSSWSNIQSVLGASISNAVETGRDWMNEATDGRSEPIINRAIENFQEELKDLPKEQVERIKYDFCKSIVSDYETKSENTKKE